MRLILATGLILAASSTHAATAVETFVSCPVGGGNRVEVHIQSGEFTYAFGPPGAPELSLSVPMSAGTVTPWHGVGRAIWSSVSFTNHGYQYKVWHSFDRQDGGAGLEAGVTVSRDSAPVAEFKCAGGEIAPVFTLEDAMAAEGYCWNRQGFRWQSGHCD